MESKTEAQAEMLASRLAMRLRHLAKWAKRLGVDAFRLYDRDIPEIPLVLDLYGDIVSGALYKRPYDKDEAEEAQWLRAMKTVVAKSVGIEENNIIIKLRQRQRGQAQYEKVGERGLIRTASEGELQFKVNLSDYLDTGLFLDRRAMRKMVRADSAGKRVLNLFCYTASFSVCAASGNAVATDSVDLSNPYLHWAQDNFALNGFHAETLRLEEFFTQRGSGRHRLVRADVQAFLHRAAFAGQRWDSIILDPPAFSNSTMACADFDLQRDYQSLLARCLALLAPGGKLWFSASAKGFRASAADLEASLAERFPGIQATDISDRIIDADFRGKKTPKTYQLAVCALPLCV
jgi:23S rRNA G2069 N7-methylase RlmK/C1962 C5-methylase RlmI